MCGVSLSDIYRLCTSDQLFIVGILLSVQLWYAMAVSVFVMYNLM